MKNFIIILVILVLLAVGSYFFFVKDGGLLNTGSETDITNDDQQGTVNEAVNEVEKETKIGASVEGRDITAYHYGTGDTELLFVGGIHGGYSTNTSLVAFELMDYLEANPEAVPSNVKVTVVPVLNPDGLFAVVGKEGRFTVGDVPSSSEETIPGRFNANDVDLNRNFACDWKAEGTWQGKSVSGGESAFSEPESQAIRDYVAKNNPTAVVAWYSAAGGVFASNCHNGVLAETRTLTDLYAKASGYKAYEEFNYYAITGDMTNWLAGEKVPAISVLLTTHESVEWDKNQKGIDAMLEHYADPEEEKAEESTNEETTE